MSVSVVVVTRRRRQLLAALLASLRKQTHPCQQVLVVDHAAERDVEDLTLACGVDYVCAAGLSLGAARQVGVEKATGEFIAFIDDDCIPDSDWLEELTRPLLLTSKPLGVQGMTVPEPGPIGSHAIHVTRPDGLFRTCNIAYRRSAIEAAGGFDTRFHGWFEDAALAARVLRFGPIGWQAQARVMHRAMPRRAVTRQRWGVLLRDERLLATDYRTYYRRYRGPGFLVTVIARWLLGSPAKTLWRELPRARDDAFAYARLACLLVLERWNLLKALGDLVVEDRIGHGRR